MELVLDHRADARRTSAAAARRRSDRPIEGAPRARHLAQVLRPHRVAVGHPASTPPRRAYGARMRQREDLHLDADGRQTAQVLDRLLRSTPAVLLRRGQSSAHAFDDVDVASGVVADICQRPVESDEQSTNRYGKR